MEFSILMEINLFDLNEKIFFVGLAQNYTNMLKLALQKKIPPLYKNCKKAIEISDSNFSSHCSKGQFQLKTLKKLAYILNLNQVDVQKHVTYIKSGFSDTNRIKPPFPIKLSKELARIIAHLIGDGHLNLNKRGIVQCAYYNQSEALRNLFKNDVKKIFGVEKLSEGINKTTPYVRVLSSVAHIIFSLIGDCNSKKARVSNFIKTADVTIQKEFLSAFFDDEAHVRYKPPFRYVEIALCNEPLLEDLKDLLRNFGINPSRTLHKQQRGFAAHTFYIRTYLNLQLFAEKTGFYHPSKREKMQKILKDPGRKSYAHGETEERILNLLEKGLQTSDELSKVLERKRCTINLCLKKLEEKRKIKKASFSKKEIIWVTINGRTDFLRETTTSPPCSRSFSRYETKEKRDQQGSLLRN